MGPGNTDLVEQARAIFDQLGYTVTGSGPEFLAEREWKAVRVLATTDPTETPEDGTLRCFVTPAGNAGRLRRRLRELDPTYEWAVISVEDDDYEVVRAPPGPKAAV